MILPDPKALCANLPWLLSALALTLHFQPGPEAEFCSRGDTMEEVGEPCLPLWFSFPERVWAGEI